MAVARQVSRFEKILLSPGVFRVVKDGKTREVDNFPPERLLRMAKTAQQMLDDGLKIPSPFSHYDKNGELPAPVTISDNGDYVDPVTGQKAAWDASINGGFYQSFFINELGQLVGIVESFGDSNNPNDPAGKLGTTVQETSLGIAREYKSGNGKTYSDAPVHIAACINAVEPNQPNFVPIAPELVEKTKSGMELVSMSTQLMSTYGAPAASAASAVNPHIGQVDGELTGETVVPNIFQLLILLRECGIDIPADTVLETLIERLTIALLQKRACEREAEKEEHPTPPKNSTEKAGYTTMTQTATPITPAPVVPVVPTEPQKLSATEMILMSTLVNGQRKTIEERITALIKSGVSQAWIDKHIKPKMTLDMTTMSINDLDPARGTVKNFSEVEALLDATEEALASKTKSTTMLSSLGYMGGDQLPEGAQEISLAEITAANKEADDELFSVMTGEEALA